jgi:adenylate kinase
MACGFGVAVVPVTGPPGAGKSTALLALDSGLPELARFGVRDYGLLLAAAGDPLGLAMRDALVRQELVSDELVLREFLHFMAALPERVLVVAVEGYPRDTAQCRDLVGAVGAIGARLTAFVVVDVPDEVARARVAGRRLCVRCGTPAAGPAAAACAGCGGPVSRRADDDAGRFDRRLASYREVSQEPRGYFAGLGLLRAVDGTRPSAEVRTCLAGLLGVGMVAAR